MRLFAFLYAASLALTVTALPSSSRSSSSSSRARSTRVVPSSATSEPSTGTDADPFVPATVSTGNSPSPASTENSGPQETDPDLSHPSPPTSISTENAAPHTTGPDQSHPNFPTSNSIQGASPQLTGPDESRRNPATSTSTGNSNPQAPGSDLAHPKTLPTGNSPVHGSPSTRTKTTLSSTVKTSSSSSSKSNAQSEAVCQEDEWNKANWKKMGMDPFLEGLVSSQNPFEKSLPVTVAKQAVDFYNYECSIDDCDLNEVDPQRCKLGANANLFFILKVYERLWHFIHDVQKQVDMINGFVQSQLPKMSIDFAPADLGDKTNKLTDAMITLSGVFGVISGIFAVGDSGAGAGIFGAASGMMGIGVGVQNFMADATAAARAVYQSQNNTAVIQQNAGWIVRDLQSALTSYAYGVLEGVPTDKNKTTVAKTFIGGQLADEVPASASETFGNKTANALYGSAISRLWMSQEIFVAVSSKRKLGKKTLCDINLDGSEFRRVCDGGKAYIFAAVPQKKLEWKDEWPKVPGADDLESYGLDLLSIGKAAEWSQKKGGFVKSWSPKEAADIFTSKDHPDREILVNLPVCDVDNLPDEQKVVPLTVPKKANDATNLRIGLSLCETMKIGKTEWPYGKFPLPLNR